MITVRAPAKINLTIEVLSRRRSGFHEICSIVQEVGLYDTLRFEAGPETEFRCGDKEWLPERSLVSRAIGLVRSSTGCTQGVKIEVHKRIPLISGLGGDSSDAAATLRGLNRLWDLGLELPELGSLATRLGSDVTLFLIGGTVLITGEGETVAPLPPLPPMWVVLLVPPLERSHGKTGRLYASLEPSHYTGGQVTEKLLSLLTVGAEASLPLFNVFDGVAGGAFPGIEGYRSRFRQAGAPEVHLAGSGPALFALFADQEQADAVYRQLQEEDLETYLVETVRNAAEPDIITDEGGGT